MSRLSCDAVALEDTKIEYYKKGGRKGTGQRLGQYIWNLYGVDASYSELFYIESDSEALLLAYKEIERG